MTIDRTPILSIEAHPSPHYRPRTIENAGRADLTAAFALDFSTSGEQLTRRAAGSRYVAIPLSGDPVIAARLLWKALAAHNAQSLNIAGNSIHRLAPRGWPQCKVNAWIYLVVAKVHEHRPISSIRSGGQTGSDIAGIVAARALGIDAHALFPHGYLQRDEYGKDHRRTPAEIEQQVERWAEEVRGISAMPDAQPR